MWKWLNSTLLSFKKCFVREATFEWFVVIVMGMMLRRDHLGVTSIVQELGIDPSKYETMLHFFRSKAWKLDDIVKQWVRIIRSTGKMYLEDHMPVMIIDGVKQLKEGEDSSKARYIYGHLFGVIGIVVGTAEK